MAHFTMCFHEYVAKTFFAFCFTVRDKLNHLLIDNKIELEKGKTRGKIPIVACMKLNNMLLHRAICDHLYSLLKTISLYITTPPGKSRNKL